MLRTRAWVVAASLWLACSRPSHPANPGCCDKAGPLDAATRAACCEGAELDAAATSSRVEPIRVQAAAGVAGERFVAAEGCARDMRVRGPLEKNMAELGRLCAQGMTRLIDATQSVSANGSADVRFSVEAETLCLRVGVIASAGGLSISLDGPTGVLARVRSSESVGLLPLDGPICVREPGLYRATVQLPPRASDPTSMVIQVWQSGHDR